MFTEIDNQREKKRSLRRKMMMKWWWNNDEIMMKLWNWRWKRFRIHKLKKHGRWLKGKKKRSVTILRLDHDLWWRALKETCLSQVLDKNRAEEMCPLIHRAWGEPLFKGSVKFQILVKSSRELNLRLILDDLSKRQITFKQKQMLGVAT